MVQTICDVCERPLPQGIEIAVSLEIKEGDLAGLEESYDICSLICLIALAGRMESLHRAWKKKAQTYKGKVS